MTDKGSSPAPDRRRLLRIYLNDHLLATTIGVDLTRRCLRSNRGTPLGTYLEQLLAEVTEDRAALMELMAALELPVDRLKVALGGLGEKIGRFKLNGRLRGYSDLSRLWELDGIGAGIDLKLALWTSLASVPTADPRLGSTDLNRLIERANGQRAALEGHRLQAAGRALG